MISKQMTRSELAEFLAVDQKVIEAEIKARKLRSEIVEVRPFARPHIDKKRVRRFCLVATTADMFAA